jgi:hypothetical protein
MGAHFNLGSGANLVDGYTCGGTGAPREVTIAAVEAAWCA